MGIYIQCLEQNLTNLYVLLKKKKILRKFSFLNFIILCLFCLFIFFLIFWGETAVGVAKTGISGNAYGL